VTDDATLVKRYGNPVKLIPGDRLNFKITTPADIAFAEAVIEQGLA
jgi:2-C-methyl-D-erythritol 4-phosphate cytidylyltransferase